MPSLIVTELEMDWETAGGKRTKEYRWRVKGKESDTVAGWGKDEEWIGYVLYLQAH